MKKPRLLLLAVIPLFFALQQFAEGILWLSLPDLGAVGIAAKYVFLFFAFLFWPTWIPLALGILETVPWKKWVIFSAFAGGLFIAISSVFVAMNQGVTVSIVNCCILYSAEISPYYKLLYVPVVLAPAYLSSVKNMCMFGTLGLIGLAASEAFYHETMVSVWCFFAAAISLVIYKVLKDNT